MGQWRQRVIKGRGPCTPTLKIISTYSLRLQFISLSSGVETFFKKVTRLRPQHQRWWILFDNIMGDREDHLYQWKLKIFENLHENVSVWGHFYKLCISSACKFSLVTVCTVNVYVKIIRYFTSMAIVRTFLCGCYSFLLFSVINIFMHVPLDNYRFRVSVMFRTLSNI